MFLLNFLAILKIISIKLRGFCSRINYLKTTRLKVGLLFNFGAEKFEMLRRIF